MFLHPLFRHSRHYAGDCSWCHTLPLRLRSLHSHWLLRSRGAVVLRGVSFDQRAISFVLITGMQAATAGGKALLQIIEVPSKLANLSAVRSCPRLCSLPPLGPC